ncbi:MAG: hypothetical protein ACI8PQ_002367 [Planctomycetota bacterium]|jgi:hypothetical protein
MHAISPEATDLRSLSLHDKPSRALGGISAALLALVALGSCASTDTAAAATQEAEFDMEAMMADMMRLATPGQQHAELAKGAGKWDVSGKSYAGPGGEAMDMVATSEAEMIMGGRYRIEHFHSEFMGAPFDGMLIAGFDNLAGQHWTIWVDSMSTRYLADFGGMSDDDTLETHGTMRDSMTPDGRPSRTTVKHHNEDHYSMKMYDSLPDGTEWLAMEFEYRRAN